MPYTKIERATLRALDAWAPKWEPVTMENDWDYHRLFCQLWEAREDFVIIEHDIVIHQYVVDQFMNCPEWWCTFPYALQSHASGPGKPLMVTKSLGCARFRVELMHEVPNVMHKAAGLHWGKLDSDVQKGLKPLTPHVHLPAVGHIKNGRTVR